jgi:hypothetical protein
MGLVCIHTNCDVIAHSAMCHYVLGMSVEGAPHWGQHTILEEIT